MEKLKNLKKDIKKMFSAFRLTAESSVGYTTAGFLFCTILVIISYVMLFLSKEIINGIQLLVDGKDEVIIKRVFFMLTCSVIIIILKGIIEVIDNYFGQERLSIFAQYIDGQIVTKCRTLDISCFDSPNFYNQLEQMNATKMMLGFIVYRVLFVTEAFLTVIPAFIILAMSQWYLLVGIILLMIPSFIYRGKCDFVLMQYENENRSLFRKMSYWSKIVFAKESAKELRLFDFTDYVSGKYSIMISKVIKDKKKLISKYGRRESLVKMLPYLCVFGGGVQLASGIVHKTIELGDMIYFLGIYLMLIENLDSLVSEIATAKQHMFAYDKFNDFMNMESSIKDEGKFVLTEPEIIEFQNVRFRYPHTDRYVLSNFSCIFKYSEKTAIVGLNGSGKTTIIKLLLRFYEPTEGFIRINGRDIREYTIESLRKHFGVAFQEFNIYSMSIRDNVAITDWESRYNDKKIKDALAFSGFDLDCDLDCDLGKDFSETGRGLSGGEAQKIAIARCVFSNVGFFIMDEPTAALDAYAEAELMNRYEQIYKDKGLIIVSHRLGNIRNMDKIVVIKDGALLECGSHDELMRQKGEYCRLVNMQAEKFE